MSKIGIILSWAVPGQKGQGHVNEKSNEAVIKVTEKQLNTIRIKGTN